MVKALIPGSGDLGLILSLQMLSLRLRRSLWCVPLCQLGCCASRNEPGEKADRTVPGSGGMERKVRGPGSQTKIEFFSAVL